MKIFFVLLPALVLVISFYIPSSTEIEETQQTSIVVQQEKDLEPIFSSKVITFKEKMSFYSLMKEQSFMDREILKMIELARPFINLAQLPLDSELELLFKDGLLYKMRLFYFHEDTLLFEKAYSHWTVSKEEGAWTLAKRAYQGEVETTLWESLVAAGLDNQAVFKFAEIFAWQVDFGREVQKGDQWKILLEEKTRKDESLGWGHILYAEYIPFKKDPVHAVLFWGNSTSPRYYSLDGENLAGLFLKSPVSFTRISSKFKRKRYHPILKRVRPHYGIDYAAASGTPVYSVGDGVVKKRAYSRGSGNYIQIKHNSIYETVYRHLKGFAKKIRKNKKVKQGELIGYVGSTGLATGPHLHFEFLKNRKHVDPLGTKFPRASQVPFSQKEEFRKVVLAFQEDFDLLIGKSAG